MHIPDGIIPISHCLVYWILIIPFLAVFFYKLRKDDTEENRMVSIPIFASFVFVVTFLEIPTPLGIPVHFIMIPFVAIALGPFTGVTIAFLCLSLQALFGEGGFTTLGANVFVMGVCCAFVSVFFYRLISRLNERIGIFSAVFIGIAIAAIVNALILSAAGYIPLSVMLPFNLSYYSVEGILEGIVTIFIIGYIYKVKPEILETEKI